MERFVRYWSPGILCGEPWDVPRETEEPAEVEWPDNAYAFQFVEKASGESEDGIPLSGERIVDGRWYYHPDSKIVAYADIPEVDDTLRMNMRCNGWDSVIFSRWDSWPQPYDPEKMVILKRQDSDDTR